MAFYEFTQNNSGGFFKVDDKLCHRLYIEADSYKEAHAKAEELGCYWDGVDRGLDCPCCGDRWHIGWLVKYKEKESLEEYVSEWVRRSAWTYPGARIFYKNGEVKEFYVNSEL